MAHVAPIYPNFARGEVSPLMFGRVDIEQYPTCLDKCRNAYIRPYGCVTRLTGTQFVSDTKNSGKVRLLKFVFSPTDSYIIECGTGYFRFYQNGAQVLDGNDEPYEITNTYSEAQLASIQYVQLDDIIKLTCLPDPNHPTAALRGNAGAHPKELIRNASNNWTFRDVDFKETPYLDQNTSSITMKPSATTGNITIEASSAYFDSKMIGANFWIGTKVTDSATNKDVQGFVKITGVTDSTHASAIVQATLSGNTATKLWGEGAFSDYRGYPAVVALYDGRLYYARTPYQPRNVYGSKPYAYEVFTPAVDNEDDAGINIQLATNANGDGSDIKWMIGASYLLCGTYGGEFVIRGSGDGPITATDISARQRTNWGGEPVQPIVAGTFVHFLQRNGNKLRQFQYDFYYDSYKAVDVSIFSEHLLASPIKEMALQKNPDSIIYLMREDGNVVMLTLEQDQSVQAWSLLEELGAKVESIQTIPAYDGNYDEVYMVMARNALATTLSITCSNPSLTITNNYSGLKEEGIETVVLTYNGTNGIWTNAAESTVLNTHLSVTSNNPLLAPTTTYSSTKPSVGTITEVLECRAIENKYQINPFIIEQVGNPVFNEDEGVVTSFTNGYYKVKEGITASPNNFEFIFKTNVTMEYGEKDYIISGGGEFIRLEDEGGIYLTISIDGTIRRFLSQLENDTWYSIAYKSNSSNFVWELSKNGVLVEQLQWQPLVSIDVSNWTIGYDATTNKHFSGMIIFLLIDPSDIGYGSRIGNEYTNNFLGDRKKEWRNQYTNEVVDITSSNYQITLADVPDPHDTLVCTWNTISGKINPEDYDITIMGTPSNNDTITLTYTTDFTGTSRFIERMLDPITPDNPYNWWYVRSGLKYDGFELTEGINLTLTGNTGTVTATADSAIFTSSKVGNRIRYIDEKYNILGEGEITAYTDSTHVTLNITTYFQSSKIDGGMWGLSTETLSGLDHLDGRTVQVFADGREQENKIVEDGSVNIDDAFVVVVGLPYTSYITTMPMEAGSQNGTAVGKRKRISEMAIRVWNSLGVKVGRDLENLYDTIYQQKEPYTGVIPNIKYNQGWKWDSNITVEQSHPYPMNILSIAPIVTEVDK